MRENIENDYFEWLCSLVCTAHMKERYRRLLGYLHSREFTWTIPNDRNRAIDGMDLRKRFCDESERDYTRVGLYLNSPCSVLEMMVALAFRCENSIMEDPDAGDRTGQWFWNMVTNIGLKEMTDDHYTGNVVSNAVDILLNRKYDRNGSNGGLFTLHRPRRDLRRVEIWYQMCWYISENYEEA